MGVTMISTCNADDVRLSVRYADADSRRNALIRDSCNIDYGRMKVAPGATSKMVLDALLCGMDLVGNNAYRHVIFKTTGE